MRFIVSVDVAQKRDYCAIQIYRDTPDLVLGDARASEKDRIFHHWDLVFQDQFQGVSYTELADRLVKLTQSKKLANNHDLLIDGTGVGVAVVDLLRQRGLLPIPIVATSGGQARPVYQEAETIFGWGVKMAGLKTVKEWHVPKVELVQSGQVAMEQRVVRVAPDIKYREELQEQLMGFKGRYNDKTLYTKYNAKTEDLHDDLITCFLQAMWWANRRKENELSHTETEDVTDWSPLRR